MLELSLREALQLSHNYIGTEHILLGLVGEGEGVAAQVLVNLGGDLSRVRDKVIELAPPGTGEGPEVSRPAPRGRGLARCRWMRSCGGWRPWTTGWPPSSATSASSRGRSRAAGRTQAARRRAAPGR